MVLPLSSSAALVRNSPVPLALYSIIKQQNPLLELHTEKLVQSKFLKMATSNVNPSGSSSGGNNHSKYLNKLRELKSRRVSTCLLFVEVFVFQTGFLSHQRIHCQALIFLYTHQILYRVR